MARKSRRLNRSRKHTRRVKKGSKYNTYKKRHTKTHRRKKPRFSRTNNMPRLAKELQDAIRKAGGGQPTLMYDAGRNTPTI